MSEDIQVKGRNEGYNYRVNNKNAEVGNIVKNSDLRKNQKKIAY